MKNTLSFNRPISPFSSDMMLWYCIEKEGSENEGFQKKKKKQLWTPRSKIWWLKDFHLAHVEGDIQNISTHLVQLGISLKVAKLVFQFYCDIVFIAASIRACFFRVWFYRSLITLQKCHVPLSSMWKLLQTSLIPGVKHLKL